MKMRDSFPKKCAQLQVPGKAIEALPSLKEVLFV